MTKKKWSTSHVIIGIEFLIGAALLGYLLYWHYIVGITRFFDVDEFTHLHWAANIARGEKPYLDFFTFFTPGFYWILMPLFWIFGKSTALFISARVFAFIVFVGIVGSMGFLYRIMRSKRFFLLPMIILAFLPMPFDKFMEVRPDNLSTLLGLLGVIFQILALKRKADTKNNYFWLASGIWYAVSMVVLVKSLPFVAMGVCVWCLSGFMKRKVESLWFLYGLSGVMALFGMWLLSLGDLSTVIYSLTKMPFEANTIGRIYIMEPHLFFFPNASFYGGWGMTWPFLTNHLLWTMGLLMGVFRLFTPFITADGKKEDMLCEVLISGIFILSVIGYVMFFPLKHSQYLIPIAIFIAIYSADVLSNLIRKLSYAAPVALGILALVLAEQTTQVNAQKLLMSNNVQLEQTHQLLKLVSSDDQVLDLDGRFIYKKDPYKICCLPFGTFVRFLSRPPRPLSEVLEEKKVKYIYQGDSGRFWELTSDLAYINEHYQKVPDWGNALWVRKQL